MLAKQRSKVLLLLFSKNMVCFINIIFVRSSRDSVCLRSLPAIMLPSSHFMWEKLKSPIRSTLIHWSSFVRVSFIIVSFPQILPMWFETMGWRYNVYITILPQIALNILRVCLKLSINITTWLMVWHLSGYKTQLHCDFITMYFSESLMSANRCVSKSNAYCLIAWKKIPSVCSFAFAVVL